MKLDRSLSWLLLAAASMTAHAQFTSWEETFDGLTPNTLINGQGGWTLASPDSGKAFVLTLGLSYAAADGGALAGGTQHLLLNASASNKMTQFLTHAVDPVPDGTFFARAIIFSPSKGTTAAPGELTLRLGDDNLSIKVNYFAGTIELPGGQSFTVNASGLPLNVGHLVVLRMNVTGGAVTGIDGWFNPVFADLAAPDVSAAVNVPLASANKIELRSNATAIRVDQLLLAKTWAAVAAPAPVVPFEQLEQTFDDLTTGEIGGQGNWTIDAADAAKATIESGALEYAGPGDSILAGGTQHLVLNGAATAKMNSWLTLPVDPQLDDTTYVRLLVSSADKGTQADPGEFFLRLAGWDLSVAAKFFAGTIELPGGNSLPVDTVNGLPLDVAHLLILRLNVEGDAVTSVDLWLNPGELDEASPDLTVGGLNVALSAIQNLELRSQNTLTRVDELLLAESWSAVAPYRIPVPFVAQVNQFEQLTPGAINGQAGWTAPAPVQVGMETLAYTNPAGTPWTGGAHALELPGSPDAPVDGWAACALATDVPDETFYFTYYASVDDNGAADPSELFVKISQNNEIVSALKVTENIFELNGQQFTNAGLAYSTTVHVVVEATVADGVITTLKGWLNPARDADPNTSGDQQPPAAVTVESLSIPLAAVTGMQARSPKARSVVDDMVMTERWVECFWMRQVRLAAVKDLGEMVQFEGQVDDQIGEGLSPHPPELEPESIASIPRADFQQALNAAWLKGLGGVADFEKANVTITSGLNWPAGATSIEKITSIVIALGSRDIAVGLGANSHSEGNCGNGYTGKECETVDFFNPAPPEPDGYQFWSIGTGPYSSSGEYRLGGMNSFDLDFDPADKLIKVALTYINWNNFQSHNGTKAWFNKPNVRVRATFTNGATDVVLLSTGFTQEIAEPYNTFFGFEAPAGGYYLKRVELFTKGNSARIWAGIDDLAVIAEATDQYAFTFNNEGKVNNLDRPIQAANWDGIYGPAAQPLVTNAAVYGDLSEGVTDTDIPDPTPGHYKAGFLFVSGRVDQPAPGGFLVYSTNTNVVDVVQEPYVSMVNPQTDWYSEPENKITDLSNIALKDLRSLSMRISVKNAEAGNRYHVALKAGGQWYVSEQAFLAQGGWSFVELALQDANWLAGVVGEGSLNLDFTAVPPTVTTIPEIGPDTLLETIGVYIDTDTNTGNDSWCRLDSITLTAALPGAILPKILEDPASQAVDKGGTVVLTVVIEPMDGVTYQWRKDGVDIEGATGDSLTLSEVTLADSGDYDVVVTGPEGPSTSKIAAVTVNPLTITQQPAGLVRIVGQDAAFSVAILEAVELTYQWRKDATALEGQTAASLQLSGLTLEDAGVYDVVVTGPEGSVTSQPATLAVYPVPVVAPASFDVGAGTASRTTAVTADAALSWTAVSNASWIRVVTGAASTGSANVRLAISANPGYDARTGTVEVAWTTVTINQAAKALPASFEAAVGATQNPDGSWTSAWFGTYAQLADGWIEHAEKGFLHNGHVVREDTMYMYSAALDGWIWTGQAAWPAMYSYADGGWVFYVVEEGTPFVYDYATGQWMW